MKTKSDYYTQQGVISDPAQYAQWLSPLPNTPQELAEVVQRNMLHIYWSKAYGVEQTERHWKNVNSRYFTAMLKVIEELGWNDLQSEKPFEKRLIGTCRDFSVFMTALCRSQGIPARARCGFATYFKDPEITFMDHWICEYWNSEKEKWIRCDAQMDDFQIKELDIDFNTKDLPKGVFLDGAESWQLIRKDNTDPELFGIFDMHGIWFAACNLIRDLASLNKVPLLPWDMWAFMEYGEAKGEESFQFLDTVAEVILSDKLSDIQNLYHDPRLKVTEKITSYVDQKPVTINLTI